MDDLTIKYLADNIKKIENLETLEICAYYSNIKKEYVLFILLSIIKLTKLYDLALVFDDDIIDIRNEYYDIFNKLIE